MNKLLERVGEIITGMSAVTFVLLMTIIGMTFLSHGLYLQIFIKVMEPWHASAASWALALGWELTVLVTTCNVKYVSKNLPLVLAICSGIIVLFFIQAFDGSQSWLDLATRWFVGITVTTISYVYSELFYSKWVEHNKQVDLSSALLTMKNQFERQSTELNTVNNELTMAKAEIDRLHVLVVELEQFKANELQKLTCSCGTKFSNVYRLASHKANCPANKGIQLNGKHQTQTA